MSKPKIKKLAKKSSYIVASDLDGTLRNSVGDISPYDIDTLKSLGKENITRIIVTGRLQYTLGKSIPEKFPVDFIAFSNGAGIIDWKTKEVIKSYSHSKEEAQHIYDFLMSNKLDFCVHKPISNNHHFSYYSHRKKNPVFQQRVASLAAFGEALDPENFKPEECSHFTVLEPYGINHETMDMFISEMPEYKYLRIFPDYMPGLSWIDIYPRKVSKAKAIHFLSKKLKIQKKFIMTIGNDYNDVDMLNWSDHSFVVSNAKDELLKNFEVVPSSDDSGFSSAVEMWKSSIIQKVAV